MAAPCRCRRRRRDVCDRPPRRAAQPPVLIARTDRAGSCRRQRSAPAGRKVSCTCRARRNPRCRRASNRRTLNRRRSTAEPPAAGLAAARHDAAIVHLASRVLVARSSIELWASGAGFATSYRSSGRKLCCSVAGDRPEWAHCTADGRFLGSRTDWTWAIALGVSLIRLVTIRIEVCGYAAALREGLPMPWKN